MSGSRESHDKDNYGDSYGICAHCGGELADCTAWQARRVRSTTTEKESDK
jgi:hypothetical protein